MHDSLLIALLAGLGGMIGWGGADFFAKKTVDGVGPVKSLVWAHSFGTALFVVVALVQVLILGRSLHLPTDAASWLGLAFFGVLQMVVYWLAYLAYEKGQLSVLNPVFASYSGLVALASIIFFGEQLRLVLGLALLVIFVGNILLNVDLKSLRSRKLEIAPGLKEISAATLLAAFWTLGWDKFVNGRDSLTSALLMYAFMSLAALALAQLTKVKLSGVKSQYWKFLVLIGLGEMLAYLAISWGYSATVRTSVVALISGSFAVPTTILAYSFLKERISRLQMASIVIIIAGVVLISVNQ